MFCVAVIFSSYVLAEETPNAPTFFEAKIGGFFRTSYSVQLTNGVLFYSARKDGEETESATVVPTAAQWKDFQDALNKLNVWQWRTNYYNDHNYYNFFNDYNDTYEGTLWSLKIKLANRSIATQGVNCYPQAEGKPSKDDNDTKEFRIYLEAVEKLLGGKEFN